MSESTSNLQQAAPPSGKKTSVLRSLGLGIISGAADDDCSAVGTYSQAGAAFGYTFLWTAPFLLPMMVTVVYLSSKLGQVTGAGLFSVIRCHYSRGFLYIVLAMVVIGNTIEAGADIGGIAATLHILLPLPQAILVLIGGGCLAHPANLGILQTDYKRFPIPGTLHADLRAVRVSCAPGPSSIGALSFSSPS
jgi:Mn2+/Fe2+ NRAMP family transporter